MKATNSKKSKYFCANCGVGVLKSGVDAKLDAGFGLQHLACPMCGEHTVNCRQPKKKGE